MSRIEASAARDFRVKAIAGTYNVLMALDCPEPRRQGLMGFAFEREVLGPHGSGPHWIRSSKVFKSLVPNPKAAMHPADPTKAQHFYTDTHPVQSFLWSDFVARPDTGYRYRVVPLYGRPGALTSNAADVVRFEVRTEKEFAQGHGVWFNRGAVASQKFAEQFGNKAPQNINEPADPEVVWLSRGLLEACLAYINETPSGDGLRVAAYEFTYEPILKALRAALDRGVDVRIVYHDTTTAASHPRANEDAMAAAGLPVNDQHRTFRRSNTKIPHNKFIVRLHGGTTPTEVWTGSTNFTPSGFLGQTNVGHRVADPTTARQYLEYWELLKGDPPPAAAITATAALTPDPLEVIAASSIARVFSPRAKPLLLDYYGRRMLNAAGALMFTAAFGVTEKLRVPIAKARDQMRFVLLEKEATPAIRKQLTKDRLHVLLSYGSWLGRTYTVNAQGTAKPRKGKADFKLEEWFLREDHFRHEGFVFFVHTKFLLIDPLSNDPLVCSGSANFSPPSLTQNDENMLLIRGNTRVADIYLTEFDRVFRHFYTRDVVNELASRGNNAKAAFLDETDAWTDSYFKPQHIKTNRRKMFFDKPATTWFANAAAAGGGRVAKVTAKRTRTKKPKRRASPR